MPDYDFRCKACTHEFTISYASIADVDEAQVKCPECGADTLSRIIRRVALLTNEETRMERLSDPSNLGALDEDDPRAMGRLMRSMANEMGEPMEPEMNEMIGRLESGESPESIEQSMDLSGDSGMGGGFDDF